MKRFSLVLVVFASLLLTASPALAASRQSNGALAGVARGSAYGGLSITTLGSSPGSGSSVFGPLALAGGGCHLTPTTDTQTTASASLGSYMSAGAVQDQVVISPDTSRISSIATSTIKNVHILSGLITASEITAVANSTGTAGGATSTGTSTFSGLSVADRSLSATPGPNTTLQLTGLGYLVLNEQDGPRNSFSTSSIMVNAIDVYVTKANLLGLGVGSRIILGHATSSFDRTARPSIVGAYAYSLESSGTGGPSNLSTGAYMPAGTDCVGGYSQRQSTSFSSSTLGKIGTLNNSASGQITTAGSQASASSSTNGLNLLNGLIQGDSIIVQANAGWNGKGSASAVTTFNHMLINGRSVSSSPPPNTTYTLLGLGTVTLNEQVVHITTTGAVSSVTGLVITITQKNLLGLPVGTHIIIGHAEVSVNI